MVARRMERRCSYFMALYCALLLPCANCHCAKPALSEDAQVVSLHSAVNLTCPGCLGDTRWIRHNRTSELQHGARLILPSLSYEDEDNYTCYSSDGAPLCTVQVLVEDDIEKPHITCHLRHPTYNITCDWQTTRKLRPQASVTLIAWMTNGKHVMNGCSYVPSARKFSCSTLHREKDSGRHTLSLCVIGRTGYRTSNVVDSTMEILVQPDPPVNVTVTPLERQPYSLRVTWSPTAPWLNDFYGLEYQVQYRVEGTAHISNVTTFEKSFVIKDALARRRHVVRVRAKEEFFYTWSEWSAGATGTPWTGEEEEELITPTDYFIMTSSEEETTEEESPTQQDLQTPLLARYVSLVASAIFVILLLLCLAILMRSREMRLLKLKGGLLRTLFQPPRRVPPAVPQSGEPLLMAVPSPPPPSEAVTVTVPGSCDAD